MAGLRRERPQVRMARRLAPKNGLPPSVADTDGLPTDGVDSVDAGATLLTYRR
jgi:hypothetical protein